MKKLILPLFLVTLLACKSTSKTTSSADTATFTIDSAEEGRGLTLIGSHDCVTCHRIADKNIGPAFEQIAKRYELNNANVNKLSAKVIKGGWGNWGKVPMVPHPDTDIDSVRVMVRTILSMKKY